MRVHVLEKFAPRRHPYKKALQAVFPAYWFPLINAKHALREQGCTVKFFGEINRELHECDVLLLASRTVEHLLQTGSLPCTDRASFCQMLRRKGVTLIWVDTRDSAGNCQFDVLPYVERYLKRQLYRDSTVYGRKLHAGRLFADYYHRTYGVEDDPALVLSDEDPAAVLTTPELYYKVGVFWGCGQEWHWPFFNQVELGGYFLAACASRLGIESCRPRPVTVSVRGASRPITLSALFDEKRYSLKSVGYQRKLAVEAARSLKVSGTSVGRVPRNAFYDTLAKSKITVSAFGWGEPCYREYEATYCGAAVLMADMSNIQTYPDFYRPMETYVPFSWDFSNFAEQVDLLLGSDDLRSHLAETAQSLLVAQWTKQGVETFAGYFRSLLTPSEPPRHAAMDMRG